MDSPNYEIRNIRRGKGGRSHFVYAQLFVDGELSMTATLDTILVRLQNTLPENSDDMQTKPAVGA